MRVRTRSPRPGTIVADIADYLEGQGKIGIGEIHDFVNACRRHRGLPEVKVESTRGALNSNTGRKGHGLFNRNRRGVYSLSTERTTRI